MAETVFILGAGASYHTGAPLMADFIKKAREIDRRHISDGERVFHRVEKAQRDGQRLTSKMDLDLANIEVLFNALEVGRMIGMFPEHEPEAIEKTIADVKTMIAQTLDHSISYPLTEGGVAVGKTEYMFLASYLTYLRKDRSEPSVSPAAVITFNYDIALEVALESVGCPYDYYLDSANNPTHIPVLKLHGSVNWWGCTGPDCTSVHVWPVGKLRITREAGNSEKTTSEVAPYRDRNTCREICPATKSRIVESGPPFIVPPTWNKTTSSSAISPVWARAAHELSDARNIVIIGYSFPKTDEYFRMLLALGLAGTGSLDSIIVIDNDTTDYVRGNIESLLATSSKRVFRYEQNTFETGLRTVLKDITPTHLADGVVDQVHKIREAVLKSVRKDY